MYGQTDLPAWPGQADAARQFPHTVAFRDTTGQIVLSYPDPADATRRVTVRFWLHNRVDPWISVNLKRASEGTYTYDYTVKNGGHAETAIWNWSIVGPPSKETAVSHPVWQGINAYQSASAPQALLKSAGTGSYLGWMDAAAKAPIEPGHQLSGFEIVSAFRPGLTTAYVSGREDPIKVSEDVPDAVVQQITLLERPAIMDKVAITLGPRFAPETKRGEVLQAYENDIKDLEAEGVLDKTSFFAHWIKEELARAQASDQYSITTPEDSSATLLEREILNAVQIAVGARR